MENTNNFGLNMRPNNKVGFCPAVQLAPSSPLRSRPPHSVHHSGLIKPPLHAWSPVYLALASAINAFLSDKQIRDSGSPSRLLKALSGSRRIDPKTFLSDKPGSGREKTGLSGPQTRWPSLEEFFFFSGCLFNPLPSTQDVFKFGTGWTDTLWSGHSDLWPDKSPSQP